MPKASELRDVARSIVARSGPTDPQSILIRRRDAGNDDLRAKGQLHRMQWIIEGTGLKLVDPKTLPAELRA